MDNWQNLDRFGPDSDFAEANDAGEFVEAQLVGAMLTQYAEPVESCTPADFNSSMLGQVFHHVNELRRRDMPVTKEIVWERMQAQGDLKNTDGLGKLATFEAYGIGIRREHDLGVMIAQQAAKRRGFQEIQILQDEYYASGLPLEGLAARVEEISREMRTCSTLRVQTGGDVLDQIEAELKTSRDVFSTGLPSLDEAMCGGLWAGKLYGLQGRMKFGKSLMASTIALNALHQNIPTLYVALEMGAKQITHRMIGHEFGQNALAFLNQDVCTDNSRLVQMVRRFKAQQYPMYWHFNPSLNFSRLKVVLWEHVRKHGVKFIVVDYWQLVGGADPRESEVQHLNRVAQWLADFCAETDATILIPAQENRDRECYMGDGLRKACDMYFRIGKPDAETGVPRRWLEMMDSRYTPTADVGTNETTPLWIDFKRGPSFQDDMQ